MYNELLSELFLRVSPSQGKYGPMLMFIQYVGASIKIYYTGYKEKWNQQCGYSLGIKEGSISSSICAWNSCQAALFVFSICACFPVEKARQQLLKISAFMYYFGRASKEIDAEFKWPQRAQLCQQKQEVTLVDVFVYVAWFDPGTPCGSAEGRRNDPLAANGHRVSRSKC